MAIFEDGFYAVKNGDMYKITLPEPVFKGAKTIKLQLRPETNAERIRSMRDGELANFFDDIETKAYMSEYRGVLGWLEWLKEEATDADSV